MRFLVSRGFELAILYILKRYRASVNNLNPKLVKPLFIYFLGLQSNKFPGRPLIHRPNPSIHLFGLLEETLLNTECINYFILLPVPLHHSPISPLFGTAPSTLLPRGAALSTAREQQSRGQRQQGTHWEHSCIARQYQSRDQLWQMEADTGRTCASRDSDFIFCCCKRMMCFWTNCSTFTYAWTEMCLYASNWSSQASTEITQVPDHSLAKAQTILHHPD